MCEAFEKNDPVDLTLTSESFSINCVVAYDARFVMRKVAIKERHKKYFTSDFFFHITEVSCSRRKKKTENSSVILCRVVHCSQEYFRKLKNVFLKAYDLNCVPNYYLQNLRNIKLY